nr:cobalamin-dependent protein [uncultured Sphaerochaeta sp.]
MSLLLPDIDPRRISLAQKIFDQQFEQDPRLEQEMDDRRKRLMFQDILYNFDFLSTAVQIGDEKLFTNYAVWLYELLCNLMKDIDRDRIMNQMVNHYEILKTFSDKLFEEETMIASAKTILDAAIDATELAMDNYRVSEAFLEGQNLPIRRAYLNALLRSETQKAIQIIEDARKGGLSLEEIYEDVIRLSMQEVGELWYQNKITVDKEHYATSTTQMILARFYPYIFNQDPVDKKILTCCIGSELHEMGGRMVADLFEYHGWESVYLGAAVPIPSLVSAVAEHQPDLVALSVTMPQHLQTCYLAVKTLKEKYPSLLVAVGGRAFKTSGGIYKTWPIDVYTELATELVLWADKVDAKS